MPGITVGIDLAHNFVHRHGIGVSADLLCGFGQFMLPSDLTGSVAAPGARIAVLLCACRERHSPGALGRGDKEYFWGPGASCLRSSFR